VLAGSCLVSLPLCGASGLVLVPALAVWFGYSGALHRSSAGLRGKTISIVTVALAMFSALLVFIYFLGYRRPYYAYDPAMTTLRTKLRTVLEFLSMGFGPAVWSFWPHSALVVPVLLLLGAAVLASAWWKLPRERFRILGFLSYLGAMLSLALGLGWGRSVCGPHGGFQTRYVALAAPVLCCIYFVWELYGSPAVGRVARACLFALACGMLAANTREGLRYARDYHRQMEAFEHDLRTGVPTYMLLRRHAPFLYFSLNDQLGEYMRMLHRAAIGPFRSLQADPALREVTLPVVPDGLDQMTWEGGTGRGTGNDPSVVFTLSEPRFVGGIRIAFSYPDTDGSPLYFRVFWRKSDQGDFNEHQFYLNAFLERASGERTVTIWVGDTIDQFRIHPDNKYSYFALHKIVLLNPNN
jgi:hypothetical protein